MRIKVRDEKIIRAIKKLEGIDIDPFQLLNCPDDLFIPHFDPHDPPLIFRSERIQESNFGTNTFLLNFSRIMSQPFLIRKRKWGGNFRVRGGGKTDKIKGGE